MSTKRELIIAAVDTALKAITGGATYSNNLAGRVYLRRTDAVQPAELPVLLLDPLTSPVTVSAGRVREHRLTLAATAMAKTMEQAASILADVLICVGANKTWGSPALALTTEINSIDEGKQTEAVTVCMVSVDLVIKYETGLWEF
jgi:hypothetical protein